MTFYNKYLKTYRMGYPLRGGPFSKWRFPLSQALYRKRVAAGPEPQRHRSVWVNWNYEAEIFAFGKRLGENFKEDLLKQAFVDSSYNVIQSAKIQELGLPQTQKQIDNSELAKEGLIISDLYVKSILKFWYPKLPNEAIQQVSDYLLSEKQLAHIANNIGLADLIKCEDFPVKDATKTTCLYAIIGALSRSSGSVQAQLFVNDFILTQLIGKDINELWQIKNPMGLLISELKKDGIDEKSIKSRLLWSTGVNLPTSVYMVGLYINEKLYATGSGETLDIAEDMSSRNGLRRYYNTHEYSPSLPYGDKARKYSDLINSFYDKMKLTINN